MSSLLGGKIHWKRGRPHERVSVNWNAVQSRPELLRLSFTRCDSVVHMPGHEQSEHPEADYQTLL